MCRKHGPTANPATTAVISTASCASFVGKFVFVATATTSLLLASFADVGNRSTSSGATCGVSLAPNPAETTVALLVDTPQKTFLVCILFYTAALQLQQPRFSRRLLFSWHIDIAQRHFVWHLAPLFLHFCFSVFLHFVSGSVPAEE